MVHSSRWTEFVALAGLSLILWGAPVHAQMAPSAPKNISNNHDGSFSPQVAVDAKGDIYAVWEDDTANNSNILFSRSTDNGATFSAPTNLSKSTGFPFGPRIVTDAGGGINVVWTDNAPGNLDVFFSRSTDNGVTFSAPKNLSNDPADSANPEVAVDGGGNISVVWESDDIILGIYHTHSTDGGATFSTPVNIATNAAGSFSPSLALDGGGGIYVAWQDYLNPPSAISFARSLDHGATFSPPIHLSGSSANPFGAQLDVDAAGNINVAWLDDTPGTLQVYFSRSSNQGATFSSGKNVSGKAGNVNNAQIGTDAAGSVFLTWQQNVPSDIFLARSTDGGVTFSSPLNVSHSPGNSFLPWLTVDATGNVNVNWEDTAPGNYQIFYSQSTDHGVTFSAPLNLANDTGLAMDPQSAADSKGNLAVVWTDNTPGVNQIFFSRLANQQKQNQPPVANAGPDQLLECAGPSGALVTLDGSASSDPDGDALTFVWKDDNNNIVGTTARVQLTVALGAHTFTLTVTDTAGLSDTAMTHVTVQDLNPPTLQVSLSPNVLKEKYGKLVKVTATINVSDACDPNPKVALVSITSSDPPDSGHHDRLDVEAVGGGPVAFGTDVKSFLLRAERPEHGKDLVYTVTYSATDAAGNTATSSAQVRVARHGGDDGNTKHGSQVKDGDKNGHK